MPDNFKFYGTRLTSTNSTTIVSAVTGTRIINSINLANYSTSETASVSVQVFSAGNSFALSPRTVLQTSTSSQVLLAPLSLVTADDLKASASKENVVDVVVSVLERTA